MWLSAIKLAVSAGSKIYANKQRTKIAMSDAQLMHASRMAEGKEAYQGKLLNCFLRCSRSFHRGLQIYGFLSWRAFMASRELRSLGVE